MHRHAIPVRARLKTALLGGAAAALLATSALAQDDAPIAFDIASQEAGQALNEFSRQSGLRLLFPYDAVEGKRTPAVKGAMSPDEALNRLVAATGLVLVANDGQTVTLAQPEGGSSPQGGGAGAGSVEALIVTAQKKEEAIQDVPIAISAFSQEALEAQKLEGGFDLLKAIPNVTFSKNNFTSYNFSIRGIGTKAISATTDPAVAVSFNNVALLQNRLFEQEYFDVERVEVLRGPQGTLYGRNATSGVINVISAQPRLGQFAADIKAETGNFNARRVKAMVNVPVGDTLAVRLAGAWTQRDGFAENLLTGEPVDGRDLWSSRVTVGWEPTANFRANLLWEHFEEDDNRLRSVKQLCHRDPGLAEVDGVPVEASGNALVQDFFLGQGCLPGSLYDKGAFWTPNGASSPFIFPLFAFGSLGPDPDPSDCNGMFGAVTIINTCSIDPYGNRPQSRDLRAIETRIDPVYQAKADVFQLNVDFDITDSLTLSSQTVYNQDEVYSTQDFNRFNTLPVLNDSSVYCTGAFLPACRDGGLTPGGLYTDPQLGPSDTLMGQDQSTAYGKQFTQELRLQSNLDSRVNFSLGANYTRFTTDVDYFVFYNAVSLLSEVLNRMNTNCRNNELQCVYIDPTPLGDVAGDGHNYFRSTNPYRLTSSAAFGEIYWNITEALKLTAGARWTWDRKTFTPVPSQTLLYDYRHTNQYVPGSGPEACDSLLFCAQSGTAIDGRGYPANPDIVQEWREPTGRLVLDWKPDLAFTNETMVYASLSHGYKGGGANPPTIAPPSGQFIADAQGAIAPPTFEPEFVDAFEVGSKNTLLDGALILNGTAFYYDYKGYQVSKIIDRSAANENFDATIWGLEFEGVFAPTRNLRFNWAAGYLDTEIAAGEQSIDLMDRTQGGFQSFTASNGVTYDEWVVLKPWVFFSSNCIAPAVLVGTAMANGINGDLTRFCPGGGLSGKTWSDDMVPGTGVFYDPAVDAPNGGAGFFDDIGGNELPNAPHFTASLGGQYTRALPGGWDATLRGDFYWQSQSFARVYNTQYDKLRAWTNTNISLWFEQPDWGVTAEVYVKNVFDEMPITDAFLNADDQALTTNVFTLDPRLVGVSVRKTW